MLCALQLQPTQSTVTRTYHFDNLNLDSGQLNTAGSITQMCGQWPHVACQSMHICKQSNFIHFIRIWWFELCDCYDGIWIHVQKLKCKQDDERQWECVNSDFDAMSNGIADSLNETQIDKTIGQQLEMMTKNLDSFRSVHNRCSDAVYSRAWFVDAARCWVVTRSLYTYTQPLNRFADATAIALHCIDPLFSWSTVFFILKEQQRSIISIEITCVMRTFVRNGMF